LNLDISSLMADAKITGASFAVIRDGQITRLGAEGYANTESNVRATQSTAFEAASLGKPVFAYAVLKLADVGLLDLDKPLDAAGIGLEIERDAPEITARHILSHTSGLPNWRSPERPMKVYFPPGHRFSYSGEGFVWLQRTIEVLTRVPLESVIRRLVFEPLGMGHSSFEGNGLPRDIVAVPHDAEGNTLLKRDLEANAASSLVTTSEDYARFLLAVLAGDGLAPSTATAWLRPVRQVPRRFFSALDPMGDPETDPAVSWGLGWGLEGEGGRFFHWGSNPGFKSFALGSAVTNAAIVVLSTGSAELAFGPQLARAVLPEAHPCLDWFARG
jgi:CubicO group peptidase (beta-lactamase class C family)